MRRFVRGIDWLHLTCVVLLSVHPGLAKAEGSVQFCWAMGRFDGTVYYAEAENREDRKQHFAEMLHISGIDYDGVNCVVERLSLQEPTRKRLLRAWQAAELEIVDTTFLSDMDY